MVRCTASANRASCRVCHRQGQRAYQGIPSRISICNRTGSDLPQSGRGRSQRGDVNQQNPKSMSRYLVFDSGGDIHIAMDACFSHRHLRSAGDSPKFYEPSLIVPKAFVDAVGTRIEYVRKKPVKKGYKPKIPDSAVDACQGSHIAADGKKVKTADLRFDDTGLMALNCRHDIPIALANVDTPGEQQKYAIALIEYLFSLLPEDATVITYYDIGCVLDRSVNMVRRFTLCFCPALILCMDPSMTSFRPRSSAASLGQHRRCMLMVTNGHVS